MNFFGHVTGRFSILEEVGSLSEKGVPSFAVRRH